MSNGMRRTSGEIINATLLEVFLALTFVVFSVAAFEQSGRERAELMVDSTRGQLQRLQHTSDSLEVARETIASLTSAVDSLTAKSRIPPYCEPGAVPLQLVTITLYAPDRLVITPTREKLGLRPRQTFSVAPSELGTQFASMISYGADNHNCKFVARIVDTPRISKADLKRLCARIQIVFKVQGCFA